MPNYDYKCLVCGYTFEHFQKMSDDLLTDCPECGGGLKRLIGAGLSPIFKGKGFYQTDYKNNATKYDSDFSSDKSASKKASAKSKPEKKTKPE